MRYVIAAAALALMLGGCLQRIEQPVAGADRCDSMTSGRWAPVDGVSVAVEAASLGPTCAEAVATIVVRDENGVLFAHAYPAAQVMVLAGARNEAAMRTALGEWIDSSNNTVNTSSALPDWPAGSPEPVSGEFPLYVDDSLDRTNYLALRERNVPVFCYVQGMESLNCMAYENGLMTPIGVQTFPG
jgi:hypothetical protein